MWKHACAVEREERQARREKEKDELEMQRIKMENDEKERKRLHDKDLEEKRLEVRMKELELQEREMRERETNPVAMVEREAKHEVKFILPKYVEGEDIDVFLRSFERLATLHKWQKAEWALRLIPQLTGKALDTYARLGEVEANDYDVIKNAILKRYNLTASTYKDKFRGCKQFSSETFREFSSRATNYFDHWCQMEKVPKNSSPGFNDKGQPSQGYTGKDKAGLIHSPTISRKGVAVELPVIVDEKKSVIESVIRQSGLRIETVSDRFVSDDDKTGVTSDVTLANGNSQRCPEVWIQVDTPYVKGKVVALVMNSPFADLIVGNFTRVDIPVERSTSPVNPDDEMCQAVETRASAKKVSQDKDEGIGDRSVVHDIVSRKEWIEEQGKDPSLEQCRNKEVSEGTENGRSYIMKENRMMYRVFTTVTDEVLKQVIVPIDYPFQRVAIDMVGPLPKTKRGNQYILVMCDYATKYPEAIPLRSQDAEVVAEAMMEVFTRLGVPKEILSDQGTNFMSSLITELCKLLSIRKLNTTPYHSQANGLVERFNGTLKRMLQIYAQDEPERFPKRQLDFLLLNYFTEGM
ncbi:uncharacterized protein [Magallana gigas]|uniref:uncharacterized protein n=1 Tax=Magallana gigas TaxID=29159 RepID=UPI00333F38EC